VIKYVFIYTNFVQEVEVDDVEGLAATKLYGRRFIIEKIVGNGEH
jgi:hypothetical protein